MSLKEGPDSYEIRNDYLSSSKERALKILETGNTSEAFASMLSDLNKEPEYFNPQMVQMLAITVMFNQTPEGVKNWIEGFN